MAPFSEQCNLQFLSTKVLQGSVATRVNYDRIFIDSFTANLLQSVMAKKIENRLAFRRVTGKNKVAPFFPDTVYIQHDVTIRQYLYHERPQLETVIAPTVSHLP